MKIHNTAIIDKNAKIDPDVEIGPYSVIGPNVTLGKGTKIGAHCVIEGHTEIGKNCQIFSSAVIGSAPQDLKYKGERSFVKIGDHNVIREFVTINPGTGEGGETVLGNNNELMAYSHIAHDCKIGSRVIIANVGTLAGHVEVEDNVVIGGLAAVHQFVRIGKFSIIGGLTKVIQDILPFSMAVGNPAKLYSINVVGLRRAGMSEEKRQALKKTLKILSNSEISTPHAIKSIKETIKPATDEVVYLLNFIKKAKRGITR